MANLNHLSPLNLSPAGKIYLVFDNLSFNCIWYFLCFAGLNFKPELRNDI